MPLTPESALRKDRTTTAILEHRHLAVIADILRTLPDNVEGIKPNTAQAITRYFARALARTNPRFSTDRFIRAVEE